VTTKQKKTFAQKIAALEKRRANASSTEEKAKCETDIMKIMGQLEQQEDFFEAMADIDIMVQELLAK
jgi:hypothetical protein